MDSLDFGPEGEQSCGAGAPSETGIGLTRLRGMGGDGSDGPERIETAPLTLELI